jgi:hypothetical protein
LIKKSKDDNSNNKLFQLSSLSKIYWSKLILAIVSAILCSILGLTGLQGIAFGVVIYFSSYMLTRYVFKIDPSEVGGIRTIFTKGIGTYFFTWITTWTIISTILSV